MSTKNQKQSGGDNPADGSCRSPKVVHLTTNPSDDELNVMIDQAVREAEIKLAGTPVVSSQNFESTEVEAEEPSELVH